MVKNRKEEKEMKKKLCICSGICWAVFLYDHLQYDMTVVALFYTAVFILPNLIELPWTYLCINKILSFTNWGGKIIAFIFLLAISVVLGVICFFIAGKVFYSFMPKNVPRDAWYAFGAGIVAFLSPIFSWLQMLFFVLISELKKNYIARRLSIGKKK